MRSPEAVVVDDSQFMRGLIADLLEEGGVPVVGSAANGADALEVIRAERPDVVTMDVEMPGMDGLEAVERIMADCPTPVLMLSAYTDDDAAVTLDALDRGAVDFFAKPGGEVSMGVSRLKRQLVETVRSVADADISNGGRARSRLAAAAGGAGAVPFRPVDGPLTVVVGASTGGPNAVERVLSTLPLGDCRVLVVQHMPEAFTARFARRLDAASAYDVREATDGARIGAGEALVARGGAHMEVTSYRRGRLRVRLREELPGRSVRPSVDVTMESAASVVTDPLVGVVLTGMGGDGADGIAAISRAGGRTLAQSEDTCVIYGMPKRAVETGRVDAVRPLDDIGRAVTEEGA